MWVLELVVLRRCRPVVLLHLLLVEGLLLGGTHLLLAGIPTIVVVLVVYSPCVLLSLLRMGLLGPSTVGLLLIRWLARLLWNWLLIIVVSEHLR